jgi:hypothetical protein
VGVQFEQFDFPGFDKAPGIAWVGDHSAAWFKDSEDNLLVIVQLSLGAIDRPDTWPASHSCEPDEGRQHRSCPLERTEPPDTVLRLGSPAHGRQFGGSSDDRHWPAQGLAHRGGGQRG